MHFYGSLALFLAVLPSLVVFTAALPATYNDNVPMRPNIKYLDNEPHVSPEDRSKEAFIKCKDSHKGEEIWKDDDANDTKVNPYTKCYCMSDGNVGCVRMANPVNEQERHY